MMAGDDEEDESRELSPAERRKLREFLTRDRARLEEFFEREDRIQWFYASLRVWGGWIATGVVACYGAYTALRDTGFFRKLFGGP